MVVLEVIVLKGLIVHQSSMKITLDLKEISSQTKKYLKEEKVKQSRQKYSCQWPPSTFPTPLPPDFLPHWGNFLTGKRLTSAPEVWIQLPVNFQRPNRTFHTLKYETLILLPFVKLVYRALFWIFIELLITEQLPFLLLIYCQLIRRPKPCEPITVRKRLPPNSTQHWQPLNIT